LIHCSIGQALGAGWPGPLWIELDGQGDAPGAGAERLLGQIDRGAGECGLAAVVAAPRAMIDAVAAQLSSPAIEILIAPSAGERAAAAAMLTSFAARGPAAWDTARDVDSSRLRQLSDEVARIAATLARLSGEAGDGLSGDPLRDGLRAADDSDAPSVGADTVRAAIRARRLRERYFDSQLFADPAWDMLLDLFAAEIAQSRVPVSSLCIAAAVPPTTALRWIKAMTQSKLFVRRADPRDGRRIFVELAPATSLAMRRYFAALDGTVAA
jgi:hypothetical protein